MLAVACTLDYEPAMRAVFASDPAVAARWHVAAPCTLDAAVAHSVLTLKTTTDDFFFYEIWEENALVGFFGVEENFNYIPTFGLVARARTPATRAALAGFFRMFTDAYRAYAVGANAGNEPAVRFLSGLPGLRRHPLTPQHLLFISPIPCPPSS